MKPRVIITFLFVIYKKLKAKCSFYLFSVLLKCDFLLFLSSEVLLQPLIIFCFNSLISHYYAYIFDVSKFCMSSSIFFYFPFSGYSTDPQPFLSLAALYISRKPYILITKNNCLLRWSEIRKPNLM